MIEIGWQDLLLTEAGPVLSGHPRSTLVDPQTPISPQTSAIHHLVDEDVAGAPVWLDAAPSVLRPDGVPITAFAAHRSAFERRWCEAFTAGHPWICTFKTALRVWPDAPSHSNQSLRYWRRPAGLDRATANPAHRAAPDAYVTAHLLRDMFEAAALADLLSWSAEPPLFVRVPFGPERGRRFDSLDDDTLAALATSTNAEIAFSARHWRGRPVAPVEKEVPRQTQMDL